MLVLWPGPGAEPAKSYNGCTIINVSIHRPSMFTVTQASMSSNVYTQCITCLAAKKQQENVLQCMGVKKFEREAKWVQDAEHNLKRGPMWANGFTMLNSLSNCTQYTEANPWFQEDSQSTSSVWPECIRTGVLGYNLQQEYMISIAQFDDRSWVYVILLFFCTIWTFITYKKCPLSIFLWLKKWKTVLIIQVIQKTLNIWMDLYIVIIVQGLNVSWGNLFWRNVFWRNKKEKARTKEKKCKKNLNKSRRREKTETKEHKSRRTKLL